MLQPITTEVNNVQISGNIIERCSFRITVEITFPSPAFAKAQL